MIRLVRAPLAAVLAFVEEWQPATTPRRTMQDAVDELNAYEAEHETLPESEPVTTSAGEKVIPAEDMHPDAVYGRLYVEQAKARAWSQSSPNPHGDLSRNAVAASAETSEEGSTHTPESPSSHPTFDQDDVKRICGWVRAAVRTDKADDALLRGFLRLVDIAQQK